MTSGTIGHYGSTLAGMALAALLTACLAAPARAGTETRVLPPFHTIAFQGSWNVEVTVGKAQSVVFEGDASTNAHIKSEVVDGQLSIGLDRSFRPFRQIDTSDLTARITVPSLTGFSLNGSGNANVAGLHGGGASFVLDGSGDLSAAGQVETLALSVNGSGNADFSRLVADKASATINGSGDATVRPSQSLSATVNGSGQVTYIGSGAKVTSVIHGSGSVDRR